MAVGGSPKQPPPEASSAIAAHQLGTWGLAETATPRGVLRNRGTSTWHSGARQSSHPPRRPPQSRHINLALGGSPKQPPPKASSGIAAHQLGTWGLAEAATPRGVLHNRGTLTWHSGARRSYHPPRRPPESRNI